MLSILALGSLSAVEQAKTESNSKYFDKKEVYIVSLKNGDESTRKSFLSRLSTLDNYEIRNEYNHAITGYSISLTSDEADTVLKFKEVDGVYHNQIYSEPTTTLEESDGFAYDSGSSKTMDIDYSVATHRGAGITIGILDTGLYMNQVADNASDTSDKAFRPLSGTALNSAVFTEESLKAKVDSIEDFTGKDYVYKNSKIFYEYDYADKDNNVHPGSYDHGTHVASLASANSLSYTGASPDSQLAILKVFGSSGTANTEDIVTALDDAYALGLDVINMSLGSSLLEYEDMEEETAVGKAIKTLKDSGVAVNIAMGNDSRRQFSNDNINYGGDKLTTSSVEPSEGGMYSLFKNPNLVASSTLDESTATYFKINGEYISYKDEVYDITMTSFFDSEKEISFDYLDAVSIAALAYKDNEEKIAVIDDTNQNDLRSICVRILSGGYGGVVILSDREDRLSYRISHDEKGQRLVYPRMPVVYVNSSFKDKLKSAKTLSLYSMMTGASKRTVSDFSTDGPSAELTLNPDISAPGTGILGASNASYVKKSGTSMATPNFSGACALVLSEAKNSMTEEEYSEYKKDLLASMQSTASEVYDEGTEANDSLNLASPRRAGAGMVDVKNALTSDVYLESKSKTGEGTTNASIELYGDGKSDTGKLKLDFISHSSSTSNVSYKAKLYIATPKAELGISEEEYAKLTDSEKSSLPTNYEKTYLQSTDDHLIGVYEYPSTITIEPGENEVSLPEVEVNKEFNNALDDYASSYYPDGTFLEGYLILEPADGSSSTLRMPYLGFYGDYSAASAVEPFDFERDENKTYNSDVVNNLFHQISDSYDNVDVSSCIYTCDASLVGSIAINDLQGLLRSGIYYDNIDLIHVGSSDTKKGTIVAGADGVSDQLLIQQFVNRTCKYGYVSLIDDETGKTLSSTWITSTYTPLGTNDDGSSLLMKSYFVSSLYSSYYVPTAYSYVSLKNSSGKTYPNGNYTIRFTYNLLAKDTSGKNIVQTKDVPLIIESENKTYFTEIGYINNQNVLYVSDDTYYATIQNETVKVVKDEKTNRNYLPIPDDAIVNGYFRATLYSTNYQSYQIMVDMKNGKYGLLGSNTDNVYSFDIEYSFSEKDNAASYKINCYGADGSEYKKFLDNYLMHGVVLNVKDGFKEIKFYSTYTNRNRSITKYPEAYYVYNKESGQLLVMGIPGYFSTIQLFY